MLVTIWVLVMLLLVLWVFGAPRKLAPVRVSDGAEVGVMEEAPGCPDGGSRGQGGAERRRMRRANHLERMSQTTKYTIAPTTIAATSAHIYSVKVSKIAAAS